MLHRTELVNFADLADEDDYSFSDDVKSDEFNDENKNSNENNFGSPKKLYHCSIEQQLSSIDTTVSNYSDDSIFFPTDENDYKIDQIIKSLQLRQNVVINATKCAIIDIAHPAQYKLSTSDYLNTSPYFLTWTPINSASATEFPSIVQNNIKIDYQAINKDLKFVHFVAPAAERMKNLSQIRKEITIGRVIFHYIGFGLPTCQNGFISVCDGRLLKPYSVGRIFKDIRTPLWFIFDCDNAGSFIPAIMQQSQKLQTRIDKNSSVNWCDWYCLCATSENEMLPKDPKLPRDFLTSCLLTPVKLSILCHILKYFRISLDNPFQYLSQLEKCPDLQEMLTVITDAIASDYVKPKFFFQMFRHDKLVGTLFRRFILAQYLLREYEVHPISNPSLPDMTKHQMWQEWEASIDIWVASNLTVPPSFCQSYFNRVSNFFITALSNNSPINQSILLAMCHIVQFQSDLFTYIADFAVKKPENIAQLATSIMFDHFFQMFADNGIEGKPFESLCYIIIAMLQYDYNFINDVNKNLNFVPLVRLLFDQSISQVARTFVAAILGFLVPVTKSIQDSCMTKLFMTQLKSEIPKASPLFLPWLLILLKRIYGVSTADLSSFYNISVHVQIASCIFHNSFACRASTVSALSCFMQSDENPILNFVLLMMNFPALFDVSYLVRYQFLLFVIRFLTTNQKELSNLMKDCNLNTTFTSFSSIFERWIGCSSFYEVYGDFVLFAKAIDAATKKENLLKEACSFSLFVIKYFCYDPHPTIKNISLMAKKSFDNLLSNGNGNSNDGEKPKCHSISPPFGWNISTESKRQPFQLNLSMKGDNLQSNQNPVTLTPSRPIKVVTTTKPKLKNPTPSPVKIQAAPRLSPQISANIISRHYLQSPSNVTNNNNNSNNNNGPLFENDSDALFSILLHQLVSSGENILHKKLEKKSLKPVERQQSGPISSGGGGINIPAINLRVRCKMHSNVKNPVKIAFERETTKLVIASSTKWLYSLDQSLNVSSKVKVSDFPVSDLKLMDEVSTSTNTKLQFAVAACFDGTVKLWRCGSRDCFGSFRADCKFSDVTNPLLFDIDSMSKKIVTGRNGIQFFDLNNQKLISDWTTPSTVTALALHPGNENICVAGLLNGNVNAFDLRMKEKQSIDFGKIISVGVNEPIVKIIPNRNGADFVYCATSTGKIIEWNASTSTMKIIKSQINSQLAQFDVHKILPLVAIAAVDDSPLICSPNGKVLYKVKNIPPGSVFAFHPILPIISFGTPNSDVLTYDINLQSNDQKT